MTNGWKKDLNSDMMRWLEEFTQGGLIMYMDDDMTPNFHFYIPNISVLGASLSFLKVVCDQLQEACYGSFGENPFIDVNESGDDED